MQIQVSGYHPPSELSATNTTTKQTVQIQAAAPMGTPPPPPPQFRLFKAKYAQNEGIGNV